MRKKLSSYMTSRYILIAVTVVCIIFVSTSFFTDSLVAPLRNAVSMVVVPLQKGMNNLGLGPMIKLLLYRKSQLY